VRLIDREDFNSLQPTSEARHLTLNADGTQNEGPYLFCVNDQGAWVGRQVTDLAPGYSAFHTAPIDTATVKRDARWRRAVDLWLDGEPISSITLIRRYKAIARRLEEIGPRVWSPWDEIYHWPEASDLMWDGLAVHPLITRREINGVRQVVETGTRHDQRFREAEEARVSE
jgi:hypothetical protein